MDCFFETKLFVNVDAFLKSIEFILLPLFSNELHSGVDRRHSLLLRLFHSVLYHYDEKSNLTT